MKLLNNQDKIITEETAGSIKSKYVVYKDFYYVTEEELLEIIRIAKENGCMAVEFCKDGTVLMLGVRLT